MKRAPHPVPAPIRRLHYNPRSKKYEITQLGVLYQMNLEQTRLIKEYFRGYGYDTTRSVAAWYDKLDHQTKKQITRIGDFPATTDAFYPD